MPIRQLSPQLANQIAAGEVVERPAAVIKELVENSIDAGATQIDVEIEKAGRKRLLVRDNGAGVPQEELGLALSPYATSKITSSDDLANIQSLGFRGEALASISAVSRLTLTSKPQAQAFAWQATSHGRDMQVSIEPAAHPDGTSVDVQDLFYNTPARRKFLKSDKTEFAHIEQLIKRFALAQTTISFNLLHNGKLLLHYRQQADLLDRVAQVCGREFAQTAIQVNSQYQGLSLSGYLSPPLQGATSSDMQYCFINGRTVRDKLIMHAIKQAYEGLIDPQHHARFVLNLNLHPQDVDVNVHPSKAEVRFVHARLVHDFIYQALVDALQQPLLNNETQVPQYQTPNFNEPQHAYRSALQTTAERPRSMPTSPHKEANYQAAVDGYYQFLQGTQTTIEPPQPAVTQRVDAAMFFQGGMLFGSEKLMYIDGKYLLAEYFSVHIDSARESLLLPVLAKPTNYAADFVTECQAHGLSVTAQNKGLALKAQHPILSALPWSGLLVMMAETWQAQDDFFSTLANLLAVHYDTQYQRLLQQLVPWAQALLSTEPNTLSPLLASHSKVVTWQLAEASQV